MLLVSQATFALCLIERIPICRLCIELILLFCPRHYDGKGVLLEVCNQVRLAAHTVSSWFIGTAMVFSQIPMEYLRRMIWEAADCTPDYRGCTGR